MDVYVGGKKIRADPKNAIGKGGEADIFDVGGGMALKVFKRPDHPDYVGFPHEQQGARERIATHQRKLRQFPAHLPDRVVTPVDLATDKSGKEILGYTMPFVQGAEVLLRYAERGFREGKIPQAAVLEIFKDLYGTVDGIHKASVVIGDFNDLNVLVDGTHAHVIDTDSFQFGNFPCRVFTTKFVDPTLCDSHAASIMLA
ncbi:hypothetical protein HY629_00990, partial [Candidatus Uhrbacteria bacterium]|nr:hypothetical protein [Candidatus Uhrbacteria bacterium]